MFCKNCGKEIPEGSVFCGECGTPVENQPAPAADVKATQEEGFKVETPVEETPVAETAPTAETTPESQVQSFEEPVIETKPKKKKKGLIITLISLLLVVLIGLGSWFFCPAFKGWILKTFGSDAAYLEHVESESLKAGSSKVIKGYGKLINALKNNEFGADMKLELTVSDKLISTLENNIPPIADGVKMDLDWLKNISIDMDGNLKDNISKVLMGINVNGVKLADLDVIIDMNEGELLMGVPSLNDKYLKAELDIPSEFGEIRSILSDNALWDALPSEEQLNDLVEKYIDVVLANLNEAKKSSKTVKIEGISEELTTLKIDIDGKTIRNVAVEVLKTAKDDEDIKGIVKNIMKYLEKQGVSMPGNFDKMYSELTDEIDDIIEEFEELDEDDLDIPYDISMVDYVNSSHEIVGRKFNFEGTTIFEYVTVHDGANFASKVEANLAIFTGGNGTISFVGKGTDKNDVINGDFKLEVMGRQLLNVKVIDYKADSEYLNGKFQISLPDNMFELLLNEADIPEELISAIGLVDPKLEFSFEGNEKSNKVGINLMAGDEALIGYSVSSTIKTPSSVIKPADSKVYEEDEADRWASEINPSDILNKLKDAGILNNEMLEMLQQVM